MKSSSKVSKAHHVNLQCPVIQWGGTGTDWKIWYEGKTQHGSVQECRSGECVLLFEVTTVAERSLTGIKMHL